MRFKTQGVTGCHWLPSFKANNLRIFWQLGDNIGLFRVIWYQIGVIVAKKGIVMGHCISVELIES